MKARRFDVDVRHFFLRHLSPWRVTTPVQATGDRQALGGGRAGNQSDHGLVIPQGFPSPVGGNEREQAVLHLVPLAGSRWEMAHRNRKPRLIGQALEFQFPKAQPIAVAAAAIGRDEQVGRLGIEPLSLVTPPPPDGRHRKSGRVMVGAHIDKPRILSQIVNAIGVGARHQRTRKIVALHPGAVPLRRHWRPGFSKSPTSSFFLVSTEITGQRRASARRTS